MQFESAKRRAEEPRAQLNYHSHKYYVEDDPEIEDSEYDMLQRELASIEKGSTGAYHARFAHSARRRQRRGDV